MKKKLLYTKKTLYFFRILSLICALLLICAEVWSLSRGVLFELRNGHSIGLYHSLSHCISLLSIIFFVLTFFLPQKFGFTSIIAYAYGFLITFFEPDNYMGFMMFYLGTAILFARGFMQNHKKIKVSLLLFFLLIFVSGQVRFGFHVFLKLFLENSGGILVLSLLVFFVRAYCLNNLMYEDKRLNLACYPKLTERDCKILKMIQQGEKYSVIAKQHCLSHGSLKNRLHEVFDILETGDKQGFLSYYSDWELCYNLETVKEDLERIHRNEEM